MAVAKLTRKFQITIPAEVRKQLNLRAGDNLIIEIVSGRFPDVGPNWRILDKVLNSMGYFDEMGLID